MSEALISLTSSSGEWTSSLLAAFFLGCLGASSNFPFPESTLPQASSTGQNTRARPLMPSDDQSWIISLRRNHLVMEGQTHCSEVCLSNNEDVKNLSQNSEPTYDTISAQDTCLKKELFLVLSQQVVLCRTQPTARADGILCRAPPVTSL